MVTKNTIASHLSAHYSKTLLFGPKIQCAKIVLSWQKRKNHIHKDVLNKPLNANDQSPLIILLFLFITQEKKIS